MNLFDAEIDGATGADRRAPRSRWARAIGRKAGKVQIGVRPEFVRLSADGTGVPARITRVEDVGRHKIVRLDVCGSRVNAIADEGAEVSADVNHITFDPAGINVYADDWRVAAEGEAA